MEWLTSPETWIALLTLTVLEIVLGIDNIIFISILAGKLPADAQGRARTVGLTLAMVTRILLLLSLTAIMRFTRPLFSVFGHAFSGRDVILLLGGLFLLWKSTREIQDRKSTRLNSSHSQISYAVFCLKKKKNIQTY